MEWANVSSGVPQSSVPGPILFSIFVSDIPDLLHNMISIANDTKASEIIVICKLI